MENSDKNAEIIVKPTKQKAIGVAFIQLFPITVMMINHFKEKWHIKTNTKVFLKCLEKMYELEK